MRTYRIALLLAVAAFIVLTPSLGMAGCEGDPGGEPCSCGAAEAAGGCSRAKAAEAATVAKAAKGGCKDSMSKLIALAHESGDKDIMALADKAKGGCQHSQNALIAHVIKAHEGTSDEAATPAVDMSALAERAAGGCPHATAELIAKAKASDNAKAASLANKAENGCKTSTKALITLAQNTKSE